MELLLVRHGETRANSRHIYQPPTESISAPGAAEVAKLVRTIQEFKPTHLYTSHYTRARETAHFLEYATELQATWLEEVSELRVADYMYGKSHYGLHSMFYLMRWYFNLLPEDITDQIETKKEFADRIFKARDFFAKNHDEDRVVVVSHSIFTNFFIAQLCQDKGVNIFKAASLLMKILRHENSSVSHVRYNGETEKNVCPWEVVSFNAHKHLDL
jgi:broad specificity phosphatase PhoE